MTWTIYLDNNLFNFQLSWELKLWEENQRYEIRRSVFNKNPVLWFRSWKISAQIEKLIEEEGKLIKV